MRGRLYLYADATGALKAVGYGFRKAPLKYDDMDWVIAMGLRRTAPEAGAHLNCALAKSRGA